MSVHAAAGAAPPQDGVVDLLTAGNAEIVGPSAGARVGTVGGGGDVNRDGRADVLVASAQVSPAGRERAGSVWVLAGRGRPVDVDLAAPGPLAIARIDGAAPFDELGRFSVSVAGDVNGDGAADILVAAAGADNNGRVGSGSAYVVFGGTALEDVDLASPGEAGARIDGPATGVALGSRVAAAGDVNGDRYADLLLDTQPGPGQRGAVYLVLGGPDFGDLDLASPAGRAIRILRVGGTTFLGGIDGAGDVNADGYADLILSDPLPDRRRAVVVFGSPAPADIDLAAPPQERTMQILGRRDEELGAVAGAGDMDGDGFGDLALGAPFALRSRGAVDVVSGGDTADLDLSAPRGRSTRILPGVGGLLGARLAGLGDVDGDGLADLGAGAISSDFPGRDGAGSLLVLRGERDFFSVPTHTATPGARVLRLVGPLERVGLGDVGRVGDIDGDRRADVAVAGVQATLKRRAASGGAWLYGFGAGRPCAVVRRPGGRPVSPEGGPVELTRGQLLINQRIGQAAIRRIAAVEARLRDGIRRQDVCGGTVSAPSFVPSLAPSFGPEVPLPVAAPDRIATDPPTGDAGSVRLTAQQLLINQRIYQVALLRGRALAGRVNGRLTGGDIEDGALTPGRLTPGLGLAATGTAVSAPPSTSEAEVPRRSGRRTVRLSAAQLRTNQRIAQAAVRVANDVVAQVERGLIGGNFLDGTIGAGALSSAG